MSLREVLLDELKDLYSAENQLVKALPKTAKATNSPELKKIFETHFEETKGHVDRLKLVFEVLGKKPTGKHCEGMEGAIEEVKEALAEDAEGAVYDCGIIGGAARIEHYEIAGYTVSIAIARQLGESQVASILTETLNEELNASKLVMNASKVILKDALDEEGDDPSEPEKKPTTPKEKKSAAKSLKDQSEANKSR